MASKRRKGIQISSFSIEDPESAQDLIARIAEDDAKEICTKEKPKLSDNHTITPADHTEDEVLMKTASDEKISSWNELAATSVASGVAGVLSYLSQTGELTKRSKDEIDLNDVNIVYKDEFGRVISGKEEFVRMSRAFQGVKQSANKKDREILRRYAELKEKQCNKSTEQRKTTTQISLEAQQKQGKGYVKL